MIDVIRRIGQFGRKSYLVCGVPWAVVAFRARCACFCSRPNTYAYCQLCVQHAIYGDRFSEQAHHMNSLSR